MKATVFLLVLSLLCMSCEKEESIVEYNGVENITTNEVLVDNLLRNTQNETAVDNFIDKTSCFSIQFPYTVYANGQEVLLNSKADYQVVYDILNADVTDYDVVTIIYPVTAVFADYSEIVISTQSQFNEAVNNCSGSIEISCVGLTYPLGVKTYISHDQLAESFSIGSKKALYDFITDVNKYDAASFNYPITVNTIDGAIMTIENNATLNQFIITHANECYDLLGLSPSLTDVILQDTWYISHFFKNGDQTPVFSGYTFNFNDDGTLNVTGATAEITGTWSQNQYNGAQYLTFTFYNASMEEVSGEWEINGISGDLLQLRRQATGTESLGSLNFSRN